MKTRWLIGFVMLWAVVARTSSVKAVEPVDTLSRELSDIDSLLWWQPDSALTCLLPCFDTCGDAKFRVSTAMECDHHYANLLLAELLYKNDYAQTNRENLSCAVAYFDSLVRLAPHFKGEDGIDNTTSNSSTITFLAARAHYINGVGFYESDSIVDACKEYIRALDIMEEHFEEKELVGQKARFMALTYTHLMDLFSDLYFHEQAVCFGKKSLKYYNQYEAQPRHVAWVLNEIGSHYDMTNNTDSAEFYYNKGLKILPDTNNLTFRDLATRIAFLSYKKGQSIKTTIFQLNNLINSSQSKKESLSRYAIVGEIYYHENIFDSAWMYLNKVFHETQSISSKKQAAEWLVDICEVQGRDSETFEYASFLVPFANQEENQSEIKSQLSELYNAYSQSILSRQHQQEIKKNKTIGLVVIGGLIVGLWAYVILYHHNKRRKQFLEKQIKEEQLSHDMKQKALSGRLKQSNRKLEETLKKIEDWETERKTVESSASYRSVEERYEAFRESSICLEILDKVNLFHADKQKMIKTNADITEYKAFAMSMMQITQLTKTVEAFFPNLSIVLKAQYAALDRKEWLHCCLYLLQLDKMSICVLLQEPYYTCRRYTLKMEEKFGCRQGLSAFLIEQLNVC